MCSSDLPKIGPLEQPQKLLLELAARRLFVRVVILNGKAESRDSATALAALQQLDHTGQIEDTLDFGLIHRVAERPRWLSGSDIEQRPREAGARDSVDLHPIDAAQRPVAVRGDPGRTASPSIGRDDVHAASGAIENPV